MADILKPGRELDALVAEKLFGYVWRRSRSTGRRCIYPPGVVPEHMVALADGTEPLVADWNGPSRFAPAYSADIAAAWTVVDRFPASEGWFVSLDRFKDGSWKVDLDPFDGGDHHIGAAPTLPHAICLAALAAVAAPVSAAHHGGET